MFDYVDIGGECFNVTDTAIPPPQNGTKTYELVCKSKSQFNITFEGIMKSHPQAITLIRKYLPYGQDQLQDMVFRDKEPLKNVIRARMEALEPILRSQSQSVKNMQFSNYYENLKKLLIDIDKAGGTDTVTSPAALQSKIKKIPREKLFYILLEMAWKLTYSEKIETGTEDDWVKLLDTVEKLNLGNMVASIKNIADPSQYMMRVDMDRVKQAKTIGEAASPPDPAVKLRERLTAILQLLTTKKYLEKMNVNNVGPLVNTAAIEKVLSTSTRGGQCGKQRKKQRGGLPTTSLYAAMAPFYDYFINKFGVISKIVTSTEYPSLPALASLLYLSEQIVQNKQPGLYRITKLDPTVFAFLREQLNAIVNYLTNEKNDAKKESFAEAAALIPALSITSLINKFGSGTYNDPKTIPSLRYMIKGINLTPAAQDEHAKILTEFVTDNDLYIGYMDSDTIPMNLFEVDSSTVDVTKQMSFTASTANKDVTLESVMTVNKDIIYHQGMLALSMFMASKELLPK